MEDTTASIADHDEALVERVAMAIIKSRDPDIEHEWFHEAVAADRELGITRGTASSDAMRAARAAIAAMGDRVAAHEVLTDANKNHESKPHHYPMFLNGDHAEFEREYANVDPKLRPDWPLPSFDALDWAQAFMATARKIQSGEFSGTATPPTAAELLADEEWLQGWFANALMRGCDEGAARASRDAAKTTAPEMVENSHHSQHPSEADRDRLMVTTAQLLRHYLVQGFMPGKAPDDIEELNECLAPFEDDEDAPIHTPGGKDCESRGCMSCDGHEVGCPPIANTEIEYRAGCGGVISDHQTGDAIGPKD